jgi:hypothetical protein
MRIWLETEEKKEPGEQERIKTHVAAQKRRIQLKQKRRRNKEKKRE